MPASCSTDMHGASRISCAVGPGTTVINFWGYHQQSNTQPLQAGYPSCCHKNSVRALKEKTSHSMDSKLTRALPTLSLTTKGSSLPWGRVVKPHGMLSMENVNGKCAELETVCEAVNSRWMTTPSGALCAPITFTSGCSSRSETKPWSCVELSSPESWVCCVNLDSRDWARVIIISAVLTFLTKSLHTHTHTHTRTHAHTHTHTLKIKCEILLFLINRISTVPYSGNLRDAVCVTCPRSLSDNQWPGVESATCTVGHRATYTCSAHTSSHTYYLWLLFNWPLCCTDYSRSLRVPEGVGSLVVHAVKRTHTHTHTYTHKPRSV